MEQRKLKVIFSKSGGTASKGGITTKLTLPKKWIDEMDIDKDNREVKVTFKDNKIIIEKFENTEKMKEKEIIDFSNKDIMQKKINILLQKIEFDDFEAYDEFKEIEKQAKEQNVYDKFCFEF